MTESDALSPKLSIVVIVYNMRREAPRTLHSLSPAYQCGVAAEDYEVIVVENGSSEPIGEAAVAACGPNFRYLPIDDAKPSPAGAVNRGVALGDAPNVAVAIDGARIATPGLVGKTIAALDQLSNAVVATIGCHLGDENQSRAIENGYDAATEDRLLESIAWPEDGYRLFEIGALGGSSGAGWLGPLAESNFIAMPRATWDRLGGMDERFALPGGGLVNLDFYNRVCALDDITLVSLLGEATFHQIHGGAMTGRTRGEAEAEYARLRDDYRRITGRPFAPNPRVALVHGTPRACR